jgi:hypothetical protein
VTMLTVLRGNDMAGIDPGSGGHCLSPDDE